jgi:hypothetical protein
LRRKSPRVSVHGSTRLRRIMSLRAAPHAKWVDARRVEESLVAMRVGGQPLGVARALLARARCSAECARRGATAGSRAERRARAPSRRVPSHDLAFRSGSPASERRALSVRTCAVPSDGSKSHARAAKAGDVAVRRIRNGAREREWSPRSRAGRTDGADRVLARNDSLVVGM